MTKGALLRSAGIVLVAILTGGADKCDFFQPLQIACGSPQILVQPGTTVDLPNPCELSPGVSSNGNWAPTDAAGNPQDTFDMNFCANTGSAEVIVHGVHLVENINSMTGRVTRQLVADPDATLVVSSAPCAFDKGYNYTVTRDGVKWYAGSGHITLSTAPRLQFSVTASPSVANPGQPVQIFATITGGTPGFVVQTGVVSATTTPAPALPGLPYFFPSNSIDSVFATLPAPTISTTYNLSVFDGCTGGSLGGCDTGGEFAQSAVTINVAGSTGIPLTVVNTDATNLGIITSNPAGISCPPACTASFPYYQYVQLSEQSGAPVWNGCLGGSSLCLVLMNQPVTVTASSQTFPIFACFGETGSTVSSPATLDGSCSQGPLVSWQWTLLWLSSGTQYSKTITSSTPKIQVSFADLSPPLFPAGSGIGAVTNVTIKLVVTDANGFTDTKTQTIEVFQY